MLQCDGRFDEGWRKADSYWGIVLTKCRFSNTQRKRKLLYTHWRENFHSIRDKYNERKEKTGDCNDEEVSSVWSLHAEQSNKFNVLHYK